MMSLQRVFVVVGNMCYEREVCATREVLMKEEYSSARRSRGFEGRYAWLGVCVREETGKTHKTHTHKSISTMLVFRVELDRWRPTHRGGDFCF